MADAGPDHVRARGHPAAWLERDKVREVGPVADLVPQDTQSAR